MNFLDKLEGRFGSLAIHNIAIYIVAGQAGIWLLSFGYVNSDGSNALMERMLFDSGSFCRAKSGEFSAFPLIPPDAHPIFLIFAWYIFYLISGASEANGCLSDSTSHDHRGDVRHGSRFSPPGISYLQRDLGANDLPGFRLPLPDFELRLFFILPVKARWLGWIAWAYLALLCFSRILSGKQKSSSSLAYPIISYSSPKISCIRSNRKAGCPHEGRERKIRGRSLSYLLRLRSDR